MALIKAEVTKGAILEVTQMHTNNTHRRILRTDVVYDTSRKTGSLENPSKE